MAASLLSSRAFDFCRLSSACLNTHLDQLRKGIMTFSVHLPCQKSNFKLYMVTAGASFGRHYKILATTDIVEVDGRSQDDKFTSDVQHPSKTWRSKILSDSSQKLLGNMHDLEGQLDDLFNEVKTLMRSGKKDDAFSLLQANYVSVKEQMDAGARSIEEASILDVIALGYMAIGETRIVGSVLDLLDKVASGLKDDEPFLDSILLHMGNMYEKLGNFETAIYQYRRTRSIIERKYGHSSSFLVTPMLGMAKVLGSLGRVTEAAETYHLAIKILESGRGLVCEELVLPLISLSNLLLEKGRATEAENVCMRILDLYLKLYGEKDGRVGMAMCSLARVKCATGDIHEAIGLYRDAFQVLKDSKSIPSNDELMDKMRIDLAELLHVVGRGEEGRALLEECLLITEKYQGKDHPSCVIHLVNLAASYSQSKNFAEAEHLLRRSLQIMMNKVPPDDQSISFPMMHLAVTLYKLNRDEEAEKFALHALDIREKAFGAESIPVGEALDCLVSIQTRLEKNDKEVLKLLDRLLKIQESAFGHDSREVVETLKKVVHYLDKLGMKSEKLALQRRLSTLRNKFKQMVKY